MESDQHRRNNHTAAEIAYTVIRDIGYVPKTRDRSETSILRKSTNKNVTEKNKSKAETGLKINTELQMLKYFECLKTLSVFVTIYFMALTPACADLLLFSANEGAKK